MCASRSSTPPHLHRAHSWSDLCTRDSRTRCWLTPLSLRQAYLLQPPLLKHRFHLLHPLLLLPLVLLLLMLLMLLKDKMLHQHLHLQSIPILRCPLAAKMNLLHQGRQIQNVL